jgi:hypothetical protein
VIKTSSVADRAGNPTVKVMAQSHSLADHVMVQAAPRGRNASKQPASSTGVVKTSPVASRAGNPPKNDQSLSGVQELAKNFMFSNSLSPFHLWYAAPITVDTVKFHCAGQYLLYEAAQIFKDTKFANRILNENCDESWYDSFEVHCSGYDTVMFRGVIEDELLYKVNLAKFHQNGDLAKQLLGTQTARLVFASKEDRILGSGFDASDVGAIDKPMKNWRGKNFLGKSLTKVRDALNDELQKSSTVTAAAASAQLPQQVASDSCNPQDVSAVIEISSEDQHPNDHDGLSNGHNGLVPSDNTKKGSARGSSPVDDRLAATQEAGVTSSRQTSEDPATVGPDLLAFSVPEIINDSSRHNDQAELSASTPQSEVIKSAAVERLSEKCCMMSLGEDDKDGKVGKSEVMTDDLTVQSETATECDDGAISTTLPGESRDTSTET